MQRPSLLAVESAACLLKRSTCTCLTPTLSPTPSRHVWLVLRNRTTFAPHERRYDVGVVANVRQVMARHGLRRTLALTLPLPRTCGRSWGATP